MGTNIVTTRKDFFRTRVEKFPADNDKGFVHGVMFY